MARRRVRFFGGASVARDRSAGTTWMVYTRLPASWKPRLLSLSRLSGWPLQEIIRRALAQFLGEPEEEELLKRVVEKWGPVYEQNRRYWEPALERSQRLFVQRIQERQEQGKPQRETGGPTSS